MGINVIFLSICSDAIKPSITLFMLFGKLPKYTFQNDEIKSMKQNTGVGMVAHTVNPSIQETEAGNSRS
ncbi:rCG40747, isoform CRA_a [Rattus norvegicus]|uniref:RCG40747, isoform CRA_a n=1 Tax=Rattus norvegicus TaxID=10116 RepID=A6KP04_RAT|nr:rCG40747, isoform CRA_a [Rattus norvegicus]